ncbi:GAF domain-containing protein [Alcaligenaceae bacterium A4P071]|nr:GAF domain-containing protein [Alcaligenaceae bacterium A4P071]
MSNDLVNTLATLAKTLQSGAPDAAWPALDRALAATFGHRLFTVLAYDAHARLMLRPYSNRADISPTGGAKRVTQSAWVKRVLQDGQPYIGSNAADIASVFSEHAMLIEKGCESVLNIPVRADGHVVGVLNLLDGPGAYDAADLGIAAIFAQLMAAPLLAVKASMPSPDDLGDALESV